MITYKMSRDHCGNKTVSVKVGSSRAFSIQTGAGSLPETHRHNKPFEAEILEWVSVYGTLNQKALIKGSS